MFVVALCPDGHANANSAIVKILALKRYYEPYRECFTGHVKIYSGNNYKHFIRL